MKSTIQERNYDRITFQGFIMGAIGILTARIIRALTYLTVLLLAMGKADDYLKFYGIAPEVGIIISAFVVVHIIFYLTGLYWNELCDIFDWIESIISKISEKIEKSQKEETKRMDLLFKESRKNRDIMLELAHRKIYNDKTQEVIAEYDKAQATAIKRLRRLKDGKRAK